MPKIHPEWKEFYTTSNDFILLSSIYHVAHTETAIRILKDSIIRSGLVYDKSKLNKQRILVNWVSPNKWAHGSRYGNVSFDFSFNKIMKSKKIYWVEAMKSYNPTACRLLITDNKYDELEVYNPEKDRGPLIFDTEEKVYKWNSNICLEIMYESDLSITRCKEINFVSHHPTYCCIDHSTCTEMGLDKQKASRKLLALLLSNNIVFTPSLFTRKVGRDKDRIESGSFSDGIYKILTLINKVTFIDSFAGDQETAKKIFTASLVYIANSDFDSFRKSISIFRSYDYIKKLFLDLIGNKLLLTDPYLEFED